MFSIDFGQAIFEPSQMFVRIWLDPKGMKELMWFIQETVKDYEEKFGEIEFEVPGEDS